MRIDFLHTPRPGSPAPREPCRGLPRTLLFTGIGLVLAAWVLAPPLPAADEWSDPSAPAEAVPPRPGGAAQADASGRPAVDAAAVFAALERRMPTGVEMVAVDLRVAEGRLRLTARTTSPARALGLAQALVADPALARLRLTQQEAEPGNGVDGAAPEAWLVTLEGAVQTAPPRAATPQERRP